MRKLDKDKLKVSLAPGYELYEDEDFVYLYCGDELVARYTHYANPGEIEGQMITHSLTTKGFGKSE